MPPFYFFHFTIVLIGGIHLIKTKQIPMSSIISLQHKTCNCVWANSRQGEIVCKCRKVKITWCENNNVYSIWVFIENFQLYNQCIGRRCWVLTLNQLTRQSNMLWPLNMQIVRKYKNSNWFYLITMLTLTREKYTYMYILILALTQILYNNFKIGLLW